MDAGTYTVASPLAVSKDLTLAGENAILNHDGPDGPTVNLTGGARLLLLRVTVTGGDGTTMGHGVQCTNSNLSLHQARIQANQGRGILASSCDLTVRRSLFTENSRGAIKLDGLAARFDITNNLIFRNGNSNEAITGGVYIYSELTGNRFEFNTVAQNMMGASSTNSGGVTCDFNFTAPNNVIAQNYANNSSTAGGAQTAGICSFEGSRIQTDLAGLGFISPDASPFDYRLASGSTLIDQGIPSDITVDVDGDARPQGNAPDIGADEYK